MTKKNLTVEKDFYYNHKGQRVFTESFLKRRGFCCQSGCLHCPYGYHTKVDPNIPPELQPHAFKDDTEWEYVKYIEQADNDDL